MFLVRSFDGPSLCSTNPNSLTFCFKLWQFQIKSDRTYNTYRYFHLFSAQVFNKLRATWQTGSFLFDSCSAVKRLLGNESTSARIKADLTASHVLTSHMSTSNLLNLPQLHIFSTLPPVLFPFHSPFLFFFGCPRTFPTCLPPQLSICFSSCGCLAMEILCVLFLPGTVRIIFSSAYIYKYIYIYAGYFALGAKMLVSQYLVQFGSVPVSGACKTFCFFFISFQMARSREMFSELFIIHGNHSGHGIHLIGHYSWLLRFIAVFSSDAFLITISESLRMGFWAVWFIFTSVDRRRFWTWRVLAFSSLLCLARLTDGTDGNWRVFLAQIGLVTVEIWSNVWASGTM